jgi:tRNA(Ile)-lysidine synthase
MPAPSFRFAPDSNPFLAWRRAPEEWAGLWRHLAEESGLAPDEPLTLALSGGADSVLLTHLVWSAVPRPPMVCIHVDHGLRGAEGLADASFCARLCQQLEIPFGARRVVLDPRANGLEARAREARYRALVEEARASGHTTILTGHHADDGLETLLMRWVRGTRREGLAGLRARRSFRFAPEVSLVRPLLSLRRQEVRRMLRGAGLGWREDSSNLDSRFRRNQVRNELLPRIAELAGPVAVDNLFAFVGAVEKLEHSLRKATRHLKWAPPAFPLSPRGPEGRVLGGTLARGELMALSPALRRHALSQLLLGAIGRAPSRSLLDLILEDLEAGRCSRRSLPAGWSLWLRASQLHLEAPPAGAAVEGDRYASNQLELPFPALRNPETPREYRALLSLPGSVRLADGRRVSAELVARPPGSPVPRTPFEVELDAECLPLPHRQGLTVRWARRGERFHPLGSSGSKALRRLLAEVGVARAERDRVPLVCSGEEIVWVCGVRPAQACRVRPTTRLRLRLACSNPATRHRPHSPSPG